MIGNFRSVRNAPLALLSGILVDVTGTHEVRWCFHTTAMVEDYDRTRDALACLVGSRALEENLIADAGIGRRGGMTWIGDNSIELGEPTTEGGAVDRFVKRFGSHMSSIAVQVSDIDATIGHLDAVGVRVSSRIDEIIVFSDPRTTAGLAIEWYGGESENDPRFGTPIPTYPVVPLLDVTHMAFGGAVVPDPAAAASRLAQVFGTGITFLDPSAAPGDPAAGVSLVDMTLALWPIPDPQRSIELWNHVYERAQTSSLGVRVPDIGVAFDRLAAAGVPLVRHDERLIVVDPAATGGVIVVVVDELLAGDPRRT